MKINKAKRLFYFRLALSSEQNEYKTETMRTTVFWLDFGSKNKLYVHLNTHPGRKENSENKPKAFWVKIFRLLKMILHVIWLVTNPFKHPYNAYDSFSVCPSLDGRAFGKKNYLLFFLSRSHRKTCCRTHSVVIVKQMTTSNEHKNETILFKLNVTLPIVIVSKRRHDGRGQDDSFVNCWSK